jgi:signal transduction histidine kinase
MVFVNKADISFYKKCILFLVTLIPFFITVTGKSVQGFYYPVCEAINNNFLLNYRFLVQILVVIVIFIYTIYPLFNKLKAIVKKSHYIVAGSMFLFLTVFGVTSYISAATGYYELSLYSLFIIPVFLLVIIYAVFELDIFSFHMLGTHYLVIGLLILMGGQLFFVNGTADVLLTAVTLILGFGLSIILFRNLKKESDQRVRIEKLSVDLEQSKWRVEEVNMKLGDANERLKGLDRLKTEFVSLASHQLRSPLTAIKGYASMLMEGDYGEINGEAKDAISRIVESSNNLTLVVEDLLNVSKIEAGGMKYEMIKFDLSELVLNTTMELSITAEKKGLKLICDTPKDQKYFINGDKEKLRQVLVNLIDNSMKYTKSGQINVNLCVKNEKIILVVKDTGVGISKDAISGLFKKFSRGDGAKLNSSGSGLGLYLVKEIIEAHKGRVWIESEGLGKGSTFFVELDEVK